MILYHKLNFSYLYFFATWWCKPLIFQTYRLVDLTEFIVYDIGLQRIEKQSLWQKLSTFEALNASILKKLTFISENVSKREMRTFFWKLYFQKCNRGKFVKRTTIIKMHYSRYFENKMFLNYPKIILFVGFKNFECIILEFLIIKLKN